MSQPVAPLSNKRAVFKALSALFAAKLPQVKTFRLFDNQFEREDREKAFAYPAAFLEFADIQYTTESEGLQKGAAIFRFHIGVRSLKTEDEYIIDLVDEINYELQGFAVVNLLNPLDRKSEKQDTDHDGVIVWQMEYYAILTDNSANRLNKLVRLEFVPELEVQRETEPPYLQKTQPA